MDIFFKKKLKKLDKSFFSINDAYCKYNISKNGKILFIPYLYDDYLCIINNTKYYYINDFPLLNGQNENEIIKKLLILNYIKNNNFIYIKIKETGRFCIFQKQNIDNVFFILFMQYLIRIDKNIKMFLLKDVINFLTLGYIDRKYTYSNIDNKSIFIYLFYKIYIKSIKTELYKKYSVYLSDFSNYNKLYLFLKKKGYVDKYYNKVVPKIIKNYNKVYKKFADDKRLDDFKKDMTKKIKSFKNLDMLKLIDKNVHPNFNKEYIKNKFIEIIEKYNI